MCSGSFSRGWAVGGETGATVSYGQEGGSWGTEEDEEGAGEVAGQSGGATEEKIDTAGRADS